MTRPCSVEDCEKEVDARGWCSTHYGRWRKTGSPLVVRKPWATKVVAECNVPECNKRVSAKGYCETHYQSLRRHGDPLYKRPVSHGVSRYRHFGCRCDICRAAVRDLQRKTRKSRASRREEAPHGSRQGYSGWGCRCSDCREAWATYRRDLIEESVDRKRQVSLRTAQARASENAEALSRATKHGQEWTSAHLAFALRTDLTVKEIAAALGRSKYAVETARHRARTDARYSAKASA